MNYYSGLSVICTQVYQMVAALTTVAWWFGQIPYIVRRTPHPELNRPVNSDLAMPLPHHAAALHRHWLWRQAIFLLLLTLHKLFVMQRILFLLLLLLSPVCTIFCAQENDPGTSESLWRSALTVLCHHFGVLSSLLRHLGTGLGDGTLSRIKLGPRHQYRTH